MTDIEKLKAILETLRINPPPSGLSQKIDRERQKHIEHNKHIDGILSILDQHKALTAGGWFQFEKISKPRGGLHRWQVTYPDKKCLVVVNSQQVANELCTLLNAQAKRIGELELMEKALRMTDTILKNTNKHLTAKNKRLLEALEYIAGREGEVPKPVMKKMACQAIAETKEE